MKLDTSQMPAKNGYPPYRISRVGDSKPLSDISWRVGDHVRLAGGMRISRKAWLRRLLRRAYLMLGRFDHLRVVDGQRARRLVFVCRGNVWSYN